MIVKKATLEDLKYIEMLSKKESRSLGFIPKARYEASIIGKRMNEKSQPNCNDKIFMCFENDDPVGFVLGSSGRKSTGLVGKVHQICIQDDARLIERGKALLNEWSLDCENRGINDFACGCADDLESNKFWDAMGWEKVGERRGIFYGTSKQTSGRLINVYHKQINSLFNI